MNARIARSTLLAAIAAVGLVVAAAPVRAASKTEIDVEVNAALARFKKEISGGAELLKHAKGVLVFPSVLKAGFGIGGEYGEGALRIRGKSVAYYNTASASIGFQLGVESKAVFILFLKDSALSGFRASQGWKVGVDGSVTLIKVGAGGSIDTNNIRDPIVGFVLTNKGLMYNLTLEGSKITKLDK